MILWKKMVLRGREARDETIAVDGSLHEAAKSYVRELRRKAKDFHQPRPVGWNKPAIHRRYTERRFFCIPYRYLQGISMRPVPC